MTMFNNYRKTAETRAAYIANGDDLQKAAVEAHLSVNCLNGDLCPEFSSAKVLTREGWLTATYPFWLALDPDGRPYPIAPNVFDCSYEPTEANQA